MKRLIKSCLKKVKKSTPKTWFGFGILIIVIILIIILSRLNGSAHQEKLVSPENSHEYYFPTKKDERHKQQLSFGEKKIKVVHADTSTERSIGLSGYESLPVNEGMLFTFDTADYYSFWMRDMNFPIDIIWMNENKQVVFIKENALPEDFPKSYKPDQKATYVLEVNTGFVAQNAIKIGSQAHW